MTNLTEQWKKGKLEEYKRYYCKTVWFEDIFMARCRNKGQNDEWWTLENEKYSYNNVHHIKDIEVLAEVPSFNEWLNLKEFADYSVNNRAELTRQINFWMDENTKLKELLKECRNKWVCYKPYDRDQLLKRIDQVLANNQIQANTVACNKIQENNDA